MMQEGELLEKVVSSSRWQMNGFGSGKPAELSSHGAFGAFCR